MRNPFKTTRALVGRLLAKVGGLQPLVQKAAACPSAPWMHGEAEGHAAALAEASSRLREVRDLAWSQRESWVGRDGYGLGLELTYSDVKEIRAAQDATLALLWRYLDSELIPRLEGFLREAEECRQRLLGLARRAKVMGGADAVKEWGAVTVAVGRLLRRLTTDLEEAARRLEGVRGGARPWHP